MTQHKPQNMTTRKQSSSSPATKEKGKFPSNYRRPFNRTSDKKRPAKAKQPASFPRGTGTPKVKEPSSDGACFNCGAKGHFASDCPHPRKNKKVAIRAMYSSSDENEGEEADEEYEPSNPDSNNNPEAVEQADHKEQFVEFEGPEEDYGEGDTDSDFIRTMNVVPFDEALDNHIVELEIETGARNNDAVRASTIFPLGKKTPVKNMDIKVQKFKLLSSRKHRVRPVFSSEEKECLATWVEVEGLQAWALWDSGSTTTGVTPAFAELANVAVDTLDDPHVLQLGTIGSRSIIKFGADVAIKVANTNATIYVDVANFDRYDMIIGTPFMRKNKVHLDFEKNEVVVNGKSLPAVKVNAKDLDP